MGWYIVTKTIKGRKYRYRQRTYRVGGQVKTESKYLGPEGAPMRGTVAVASSDGENPGTIPIQNRVVSEPEPVEPEKSPSLVVDGFMLTRRDVSVAALYKEEQRIDAMMRRQGVNTTTLNPIHVREYSQVGRRSRKDAYIVFGTDKGQRTQFKREFRRALAERWIEALRDQQPDRYRRLCEMVAMELNFMRDGARPRWLMLLSDLWHQRRRGHREAVDMLAEMMQRGRVATQAKYYHQASAAETASEKAWQRLNKLKRKSARERQYKECKRLAAISNAIGRKHGYSMWVRAYVFNEQPSLTDDQLKKHKPSRKRARSSRYRRRRYPRWSR